MPALKLLARRIPLTTAWTAALWLVRKGRDQLERNLDEKERRELSDLVRASKGRPRNLSAKQQERLRALATKGITGKAR